MKMNPFFFLCWGLGVEKVSLKGILNSGGLYELE